MVTLAKYWQLVSLDVSGKRRIKEIISAKNFFDRQFAELIKREEIQDSVIQGYLWKLSHQNSQVTTSQAPESWLAESCLRCFISHQIEQVCIQLEVKFGREYGFSRYDLFPLVLDDTADNFRDLGRKNYSSYQPLAAKILASFDPQKANLSTWTTRLVRQNKELNTFLLEHGIYLVSNWAILNDTTAKQVRRIWLEFHNFTSGEIEQACCLLESYHAIYRRDRLKQLKTKNRTKCQPPSLEQLKQIAHLLSQKTNLNLSPEATMSRLQQLADLLRQYRIYVRGGKSLAQKSLDNAEVNVDRWYASVANSESQDEEEQSKFLQYYRQEFLVCLDESIEHITQTKVDYLKRKKSTKAQLFLRALNLFHCQGKSMTEIASFIGLKAQYQVTRLLKLKDLRADIRQNMLQKLRDRTLAKAVNYAVPEQLQQLEQKVEAALEEQIDTVIAEAESEASAANNIAPSSLFSQRLCHYLDVKTSLT